MNKLSKDYKQSVTCVDGKLREQLLLDYAPLSVQLSTASTLSFRPTFVEDLISEGILGLMDAFAKFDPTRDNKFKTIQNFAQKVPSSMIIEKIMGCLDLQGESQRSWTRTQKALNKSTALKSKSWN